VGPNDPETLGAAANLAMAYQAAGKPEQARPLLEETLKRMQDKLLPASLHPECDEQPGQCLSRGGPTGSSAAAPGGGRGTPEGPPGADHALTLAAMKNLASTYYQTAGRLDQAQRLFEETLRRTEAKRGRGIRRRSAR